MSRDDPLDFLVAAALEQLQGWASPGDHPAGWDFGEGGQHEGALMHAWMRYHELRVGNALVAEKEEIEIERARRIGEAAAPLVRGLQRLERVQQLVRAQRGLDGRDGIDEIGPGRKRARRCAIERRARHEPRPRQRVELAQGALDL